VHLHQDLHGELVVGHRHREALADRLRHDALLEDLALAAIVRDGADVAHRLLHRRHAAVMVAQFLEVLHVLEEAHVITTRR
jgi:hypothetical protein